MRVFPEEYEVISKLVEEWYQDIAAFTKACNTIFSEKGERYDKTSPSWHRHTWPYGYADELRKKVDRITQLLVDYDPESSDANWDAINEELGDVLNYARMFAALNMMWQRRME